MARRRLDQVDAMRPIKQAGVVSTHTIVFFAPAAAAVSSNATLLLLHVSREGFFFVSACMLTYAYSRLSLRTATRAAPVLLAPVRVGRDPVPVLDADLLPVPAAHRRTRAGRCPRWATWPG